MFVGAGYIAVGLMVLADVYCLLDDYLGGEASETVFCCFGGLLLLLDVHSCPVDGEVAVVVHVELARGFQEFAYPAVWIGLSSGFLGEVSGSSCKVDGVEAVVWCGVLSACVFAQICPAIVPRCGCAGWGLLRLAAPGVVTSGVFSVMLTLLGVGVVSEA